MKTYSLFISAPGDVRAEREIAVRVITRVEAWFGGRVKVEGGYWEDTLATQGDDQQIPDMASFDLVVCIIWSRLGSRLPSERLPSQATYESDTAYEFEQAAQANIAQGTPELLVYQRQERPRFPPEPRDEMLRLIEHWEKLVSFCAKWDGSPFRTVFHPYRDCSDFERSFEEHLKRLVTKFLEKTGDSVMAGRPQRWWPGSPYRGLQAFHLEHEAIFFGRSRAIDEVLGLLRVRSAEEKCPFVMIFGSSGSGKSSLMRAGVLPWLIKPGVIYGIDMWRHALFRPAEHYGDMLSILTATLVRETALPELLADGRSLEEIAEMLRYNPEGIAALVKDALSQAALNLQQENQLAKPPVAGLALAMDQLEEVFTFQERFTTEDRQLLFRAISALVKSGCVWVISTLRSDFFGRCEEVPELIELTKGRGQYRLLAPTEIELSQMIRYPAEAVGVIFEEDPNLGKLEEVIAREAHQQPGALPLLEYALEMLYQKGQAEGILTHKHYEEIGRVMGAIAKKAEDTLAILPVWAQESLDGVFRQLILLGDDHDVPTRRIVLEEDLIRAGGAKELVKVFIEARLFTADKDGSGQATVTLAHEALLKEWHGTVRWIDANRSYLRQRGRLASALKVWEQKEKHADYLLPPGLPLAEAETLLTHFSVTLVPEEAAYITASRTKALRAERSRSRTRKGIFVGSGLLALVAIVTILILPIVVMVLEADIPVTLARQVGYARQLKAEALDAEALRLQEESGQKLPSVGKTWVNSLGLRFVPAGTDGVLFCVYDVRGKDYQMFVTATGRAWNTPSQGTYPATYVSWFDTQDFCQWLTKKERTAGVLGPNQSYRLPKDEEWSRAVGSGKYPWGDTYPPPLDAGNYRRKGDAGADTHVSPRPNSYEGTDGYLNSSPVGQFLPNGYGLYDMGGNVYQWCDDWYDEGIKAKDSSKYDAGGGRAYKVVRGASCSSYQTWQVPSAVRYPDNPVNSFNNYGFRLVLVAAPPLH